MLLLLCRLLGRLTIGCRGGTEGEWYTCASLNQRSNLSYPLAIFTHSVKMPQKKSLEGL
jgi:hypothetical protein